MTKEMKVGEIWNRMGLPEDYWEILVVPENSFVFVSDLECSETPVEFSMLVDSQIEGLVLVSRIFVGEL